MPNHVKNQISFKGDPEEIRKLLEWVKNDEFGMGTIDFDKIIPMPEGMSREPLSYESHILSGGWNWNIVAQNGMPTALQKIETTARMKNWYF